VPDRKNPAPDEAVPLGRLAIRRMSSEELDAAKQADARSGPSPDKLKVSARLTLSMQQAAQGLAFASKLGLSEGEAFITLGYVKEDDVIAAEAELTAGRWMSQAQLAASDCEKARAALAAEVCWSLKVLPVSLDGDQLTVAMRDPLDAAALAAVADRAGSVRLVAVRAGSRALKAALEQRYGKAP
jgi:hypothetical protein